MIDEGVVDEWSPEVVAAATAFYQGDLVERPPFFYAGRPREGVWATTRAMAEQLEDDEDTIVIELEPDQSPPYGIVTSQGCDIADARSKPWVQIAPVYSADELEGGDRRLADARRNGVPHLVVLDPPDLDGTWIADLRIEMPVEKSWLSGRVPIQAFATDEERRLFGRRLGGRADRPDLPDEVHESVVRPLRRLLDRASAELRAGLAEASVEFRLLLRSHPGDEYECRLLVVARRGELAQQHQDAIEAWWTDLPKTETPVALLGCRFCTADEVTMSEYLLSELLDERHVLVGTG